MDKWEIIEGSKPVLLVAGHNAPQIREGKIKVRDWGTGNLVKFLCEKTEAWGIITTEVQPDPNYYEDAPMREKVKNIIEKEDIRLVLDIHGRRADYPNPIEFFVNDYFDDDRLADEKVFKTKGRSQKLLVRGLNIPAVEVEIRRDGRTWGTSEFDAATQKLQNLIFKFIDN